MASTGTSTYTGTTSVTQGILQVTTAGGISAGTDVNVSTGSVYRQFHHRGDDS